MIPSDIESLITAVWRIESTKIIASVARLIRDVDAAEELAQDALVAALEQWPESGAPRNPGAWLMATARRRAIDRLRRDERLARKQHTLGLELLGQIDRSDAELEAILEDTIDDDVLRLLFVTCHPVLAAEARVALALRLLGGLSTEEIGRAFLVPEATVAQRIVRAKRTLAKKHVPFEVPAEPDRPARLASVLEVIYLIFNEGYSATAGQDLLRPALCQDALRLGRALAGLMPQEAEALGLLALMELQASRLAARTGPAGEPIPLLEQNRAQWDYLLIRRGLAALERVGQLGGRFGHYALQAAIVACHAQARTPEETDWLRISALYEVMSRLTPSPVITLNRAVALGMAIGPAAGLEVVDRLLTEPSLKSYHLVPSVRADLLAKMGRTDEARSEFRRAADLARNTREQELLRARADACTTVTQITLDPAGPGSS